ncbi:MAG: acyl-CoA thioesterase [Bacteroidetes bacterium]|nr:acyl-CoA thioesterase [Bacteroidota bacterium]
MNPKPARESFTTTTIEVLPNDTNTLNTLFGGRLIEWMDITAGISAQRHTGLVVVTAAINHVSFDIPIRLADIVTIEAMVTRTFRTSVETHVEAWVENRKTGERKRCNEAYFTFVAVDDSGRPLEILPVVAETQVEKKRYDGALRRRQLSLILAGRMKPEDAAELKALFEKD